MRLYVIMALFLTGMSLVGCNNSGSATVTLTPQEAISAAVDSLKANAAEGDLITRLNDDILSEMIRQLAEHDKTFSHSGVIVIRNNQKMVCHIYPSHYPADTVQYEPLDSFINPQKNISAALFRYELSPAEKAVFLGQLQRFHDNKVHFDKTFNLQTDSLLYCTEMIAKSLQMATNNRMVFKTIHVPEKLVPILVRYFKEYNPTAEDIRKIPFLALESLYHTLGCTEIIRTKLKYMP